MTRLFGFTLLRNGVKYDYPFTESFTSLAHMTEEVFVAFDKGDDDSLERIKHIPGLIIVPSTWDMSLKKGLVLSVETNKALAALRAKHGKEDSAWGLYLQADEVLHEEDYDLIRRDIEEAQTQGCDAVSFRYLHFWKNHHQIAVSKKWYPHEIRAIKLKSAIESWGDAQGFRHCEKVYFSEARIFHYGHVREESSYDEKMRAMGAFYHEKEVLAAKLKKGLKEAQKNKCLLYFGTHPQVMKERILRMKDIWELDEVESVAIVGNPEKYDSKIIASINAQQVFWYSSVREVPSKLKKRMVIAEPGRLDYLMGRSKALKKMKSKQALEWNDGFKLIMQLSSKGVGMSANKKRE